MLALSPQPAEQRQRHGFGLRPGSVPGGTRGLHSLMTGDGREPPSRALSARLCAGERMPRVHTELWEGLPRGDVEAGAGVRSRRVRPDFHGQSPVQSNSVRQLAGQVSAKLSEAWSQCHLTLSFMHVSCTRCKCDPLPLLPDGQRAHGLGRPRLPSPSRAASAARTPASSAAAAGSHGGNCGTRSLASH